MIHIPWTCKEKIFYGVKDLTVISILLFALTIGIILMLTNEGRIEELVTGFVLYLLGFFLIKRFIASELSFLKSSKYFECQLKN